MGYSIRPCYKTFTFFRYSSFRSIRSCSFRYFIALCMRVRNVTSFVPQQHGMTARGNMLGHVSMKLPMNICISVYMYICIYAYLHDLLVMFTG